MSEWRVECLRILRYLIDDLGDPPTFSDERLQETLLVAAQYVVQDFDFTTTYSVNIDLLALSPDPCSLSTKDDVFINLMCLKAGCIVVKAEYKARARNAGFMIKDGQSQIDTKVHADVFKTLIDKGLCQEYEQAKQDYHLGQFNPGRVILGPAVSDRLPAAGYQGYYRE